MPALAFMSNEKVPVLSAERLPNSVKRESVSSRNPPQKSRRGFSKTYWYTDVPGAVLDAREQIFLLPDLHGLYV